MSVNRIPPFFFRCKSVSSIKGVNVDTSRNEARPLHNSQLNLFGLVVGCSFCLFYPISLSARLSVTSPSRKILNLSIPFLLAKLSAAFLLYPKLGRNSASGLVQYCPSVSAANERSGSVIRTRSWVVLVHFKEAQLFGGNSSSRGPTAT